jgi:RNA polymerase sigma-70 factor, ECF subfamily
MSLGARSDGVISAAKLGERWALEALYLDLHPRVLRYLKAIDPGVAEDVASEAWIGLARALPTFEGDEDGLRALLFTVARRRLLDHRRRESRRGTAAVDPHLMDRLGPASDGEQVAIDRIGDGWALRLIAGLPEGQAEVVLLRVIGDLSVEEVAGIVGKRPGAVRALQLRALRRLAREIAMEPVTR